MTDDEFEPRSVSDWYKTKRNVVIKGTYGDKRRKTHDEKLNIPIKICCDDMGDAVMMNDIREGLTFDDGKVYIWWKDGDCMPMNYCPSCGKKIERVKE